MADYLYRQPSKMEGATVTAKMLVNEWFTVNSVISSKLRMNQSPSTRALNEKMLSANFAADKQIPKVIALLKNYNRTAVSCSPSPWRENSTLFPARVFVRGQQIRYHPGHASHDYVQVYCNSAY